MTRPVGVDLASKSKNKFSLNNRKLQHPLILRNLVNKILEINQRTINQRTIHQRTIHQRTIHQGTIHHCITQDKLRPSISSNMVKQALHLHHLTPTGNSFKTRHKRMK